MLKTEINDTSIAFPHQMELGSWMGMEVKHDEVNKICDDPNFNLKNKFVKPEKNSILSDSKSSFRREAV